MKSVLSISRGVQFAFLSAAFFAILLYIVGIFFHPIQSIGVEIDRYVEAAEATLKGEVPYSKHPLLYPILSAALSTTFESKDAFAAAKAISSFSAGVFLFLAFLLGKLCFDERTGWFALISLGLNKYVILFGIMASCQMLYFALVLAVLVLCVKAVPTVKTALAMAGLFIAAFLTHYFALAVLPLISVWLWWPSSGTPKAKIVTTLVFAASSAIFLLPYLIWMDGGRSSPFAIASFQGWRLLEYKIYGRGMDEMIYWNSGRSIPFDGWFSVVTYSPSKFLLSIGLDIADFVYPSFVKLVGTTNVAGWFFTIAFLCGLVRAFSGMDRAKRMSLFFVFTSVLPICLILRPRIRYFIPILPVCYAFAGHMITSIPLSSSFFRKRVGGVLYSIFFAAIASGILYAVIGREFPKFIRSHPLEEVKAARMLQQRYGSDLNIMGSWPLLARYVDYKYNRLPYADGREKRDRAIYWDKLRRSIKSFRADFVIVGAKTLREIPKSLLTNSDVPAFLDCVYKDEYVTIYKVVPSALSS